MSSQPSITIDYERATEALGLIWQAYDKKQGLFSEPKLFPQLIRPKGLEDDDERFATYQFFVNSQDRRHEANMLWGKARKLTEKQLEENGKFIFDPGLINALSLNTVRETIADPMALSMNGRVQELQDIATILTTEYDGSPLNIFDGVEHFDEAVKRIKRFPGYGEHLAPQIICYFSQQGFIEKLEGGYPKIDIHKSRIPISLDLFQTGPLVNRLNVERAALELYQWFAQEQSISVFELTEAVWALGAYVCSPNLKRKKTASIGCQNLCPAKEYCTSLPPPPKKQDYPHKKATGRYFHRIDKRDKQLALPLGGLEAKLNNSK
ncbi:hypothetical protein GOV04_03005 [Candidatus Woesearchaeota archaeon]|nr:hypothetical protein [Candidatus Woesearchaeota archaeon]